MKVGIGISKEALQHNINARVDAMVRHGLLADVEAMIPYKQQCTTNGGV